MDAESPDSQPASQNSETGGEFDATLPLPQAGATEADGRALTPSVDNGDATAVLPQAVATAPDPLIGSELGGVTIVRMIAEGGMGRVYEGLQQRPRRAVAVKVIKPGIVSPDLLKRFDYEAQVLGRLRHPGIAQIYSVGTHELGSQTVPFFVMEYIPNAKSLTQFAEEGGLSTHERLALFAKVCEAVAHGHQKGVIHRDLKPGNVLVDSSGQPKVIDFGVARSTDSDLALTTMQTDVGALIGTLQYMSPEQFDADPNDLDVRLDVYALGVILYQLLTGEPPYNVKTRAIYEVARIVREEEPTPISSLNKTLRRDVAIIAAKCLQKDRNRRYSSATELGGDVQRYLAGEPITAVPPTFWDGLGRLARRHKAAAAAVTAIAASLVAAIVGISVFAVRADQAREEADRQRSLAESAAAKAETARVESDHQRSLAESAAAKADAASMESNRQRSLAESAAAKAEASRQSAVNSREAAEQLVQFLTYDLSEKLDSIGRLDVMENVLEKLSEYHQQRVALEQDRQENVTSDDLGRRAAFFAKLGDVAKAIGDASQSREHYQDAEAIAAGLASDQPENSQWQRELATYRDKLGDIESLTGNLAAAEERYRDALGIREHVTQHEPECLESHRDLASSYRRLGDLSRKKGDLVAAGAFHEMVLEIAAGQPGEGEQDAEWRRDVAWSHNALGDLALSRGDAAQAAAAYVEAHEILTSVANDTPADVDAQRELAISHNRLGDLARAAHGDQTGAHEHYQKSAEIFEALTRHDPRNTKWQRDLTLTYNRLGDVALAAGDREHAWEHYDAAREVRAALVTQDPANAEWQRDLAWSHRKVGELALSLGTLDVANENLQAALVISERLAFQSPENVEWQQDLAWSHHRLGDLARSRGDTDTARLQHAAAHGIRTFLTLQQPENMALQDELAASQQALSLLERDRGDDSGSGAYPDMLSPVVDPRTENTVRGLPPFLGDARLESFAPAGAPFAPPAAPFAPAGAPFAPPAAPVDR